MASIHEIKNVKKSSDTAPLMNIKNTYFTVVLARTLGQRKKEKKDFMNKNSLNCSKLAIKKAQKIGLFTVHQNCFYVLTNPRLYWGEGCGGGGGV